MTWPTPNPARRRQIRPGEQPIPAGKLADVALTNDELTRRYQAGEPLDQLAAAADMTLSGVQARLPPLWRCAMRIVTLEDHFATPMFNSVRPAMPGFEFILSSRGKYLGHDIEAELLDLAHSRIAAMTRPAF